MYRVVEELQEINDILVIDLTSGLGTKAYRDENFKFLTLDDKTEVKLPGMTGWNSLSGLNPDDIVGYQNVVVKNPGWPGKLVIFQDYGNHEGDGTPLSFDERVLFPCLSIGEESVGYYDGAISVIYRVSGRLFIVKICTSPEVPDISQVRQKRPTNIYYALTSEEPDSKVIIGVLFEYNNKDPKWKDIVIPGLTAWDIHKPSWIKWILSV
jgi:hypothetical protein